MKNVNQFNLHW